ncbi:MAG TPA: hypothetical protein VIH42_11640, partial [Thermoguttaceae bacterium]
MKYNAARSNTMLHKALRLFLLCVLALSACSTQMPAAPTAPTPTVVLLPTVTRRPAATSTPSPTQTPAPTATPTLTPTPSIDQLKYRIVGYYPSWGVSAHDYSPTSIAGNWLTHVNYAFSQIDPIT